MHELGVVFYVIDAVKETAEENVVETVESVTLQIGEVTGIVNDMLIDCWNWARKREPVLQKAELIIEPVKAITYCENCQQTYSTTAYGKICPYCKSPHTYLVSGNEFIVQEIAVPDNP